MESTERKLPTPTPETQSYWDGAKHGLLKLHRCNDCKAAYFPPRPFCPKCSSRNVSEFNASGKATLYSYIINHIPTPGLPTPFAIAVVELAEGPRMMCNILECDQTPEALQLDMPLEVTFERITDDITLPQFKPAN